MDNTLALLLSDMMKEGLIYIDTEANIQIYNKKAKEIFGIEKHSGVGHPSGKLNKGDIIIIADNCIGKDDGDLDHILLEEIGIDDSNIECGDTFIGVGLYRDNKVASIYAFKKFEASEKPFKLDTMFQNILISAEIDGIDKHIDIKVDNKIFSMKYINAIGHMVVLDSVSKDVKFYQTAGYTARGESVGSLLKGNTFLAKGQYANEFDVRSKNIFEIHDRVKIIEDFYNAAKGLEIYYQDSYAEINGYPTLCSMFPLKLNEHRLGAVLKVEDISALKKVIHERDEALSHLERMESLVDENITDYEGFSEILGISKEMQTVKKLAYKASRSNSTVLILGESGTGKTFLAESIHKASNRRDQPFIHVNCGAIPEHLLESELFGYERGAFTGAIREGKAGFFEQSEGGTIFLDEIGDIGLAAQVKLLKVLQNKTFFRVGGIREKSVDVRIIVATNKDLKEEVKQGRFREDIYYRINVFPIYIPPLRERKSDIYYLVSSLIQSICKRLDYGEKTISADALQLIMDYDWPGNIRELENILERAVHISDSKIITGNQLGFISEDISVSERLDIVKPIKDTIAEAEKNAIKGALEYFGYEKQKTMKALGMGKTNFYYKLKEYGLLKEKK